MTLGPDDLAITASTLGNPPVRDLARAASAAGFRGLSIWPIATYRPAIEQGWTDADLKALFDDHGLQVHDVDAWVAWVGPDDPGPPYFEESSARDLLDSAAALGVPWINVLITGRRGQFTLDDAAEVFAGLCDTFAEHGLGATIEFALRSIVNDVASATELVTRAGRPNGRILLDTWGYHWGDSRAEDLPAGAPHIATIQVNDAPAEKPADFAHATRYHRLVPGDGVIDLAGLVRTLRAGGCTAPLVAEVFNDPGLAAHGVDGFARVVADGMRAVLAGAR